MIKIKKIKELFIAIQKTKAINPKITMLLIILADSLSAYPPTNNIKMADDSVAIE